MKIFSKPIISFILFFCISVVSMLFGNLSSFASPEKKSPVDRKGNPSEFDLAVQSYKKGDFQNSISSLETLLKQYPNEAKIKIMLTEVLVMASEESYLLGNYDESYKFLSRALEISPNVKAVNRLYEKVRKSGKSQTSVPSVKEETKTVEPLPSDVETFYKTVEKMVQGQKEILNQTQKSLGKIVQESAEEKKQVLKSLDQREKILMEEIKFGRKYSLWLIVGSVSSIVFLVFLSLWIIQRMAARREKILIEQGEKFAQMVQEQSLKTLDHLRETLGSMPKMLPHEPKTLSQETIAKLKQIDVIDAEIVQEGETARIDDETIKSLLDDPDPEVKVRAIQILLKYDQNEAYRQILKLCLSGNIETKISAAKLMSGIVTPESVEMLIQMLRDKEDSVKRQAFVSLKGFLNENITAQMKDEIDQSLFAVSEKENWVI